MASKIKEYAELTLAEAEKKIRDLRGELLELRLKKKTGQLEQSHLLREIKKDIARLETVAHRKRAAASVTA